MDVVPHKGPSVVRLSLSSVVLQNWLDAAFAWTLLDRGNSDAGGDFINVLLLLTERGTQAQAKTPSEQHTRNKRKHLLRSEVG